MPRHDEQPQLGTHLATLNLFREPDGTVEITVAGHSQACNREWAQARHKGPPINYIEDLIVEAAERIRIRRLGG
jgi:hypothetical protein